MDRIRVMGFPREFAVNAYYWATVPGRILRGRWDARLGKMPVVVLGYHRVADRADTPWTMTHAMFRRHVEWLSSRFELISLEQARARVRGRRGSAAAAVITFDDGYADNMKTAVPLLIERGIPCTYFVTLANMLDGSPFAHDLAMHVAPRPNSPEDVRELAESGIEIGTHGYEHVDMASIGGEEELTRQIVEPKDRLEALLGRRIRYFAFPFGRYANLSSRVFHKARDAGYNGVVSAYGGYNFPGEDAFHLQRMLLDNQMARLRNRATVDPRKRNVPRFEYGGALEWKPEPCAVDTD